MGTIVVSNLGKAYKQYDSRWSRLAEWTLPFSRQRYKLHWILRDINFAIDAGEAVGLIGVNGAGKSTLLKMITRTTQPTTGNVEVGGRVAAILELGMGFHPDFTGRQNVYMAGQLLGMQVAEIDELLPEIEAFSELGSYLDSPVRVYSSGMQMRLAFSVATARRPDVLIVDEALSVGDTYFQHKSFARIRKFQQQGTTLLFVSHDLAAIRALCPRSIWLDQGGVRAMGDTGVVLDQYAIAQYGRNQSVDKAAETADQAKGPAVPELKMRRDCRLEFINNSNLRNDIELFEFDSIAVKWGDGQAKITAVHLQDASGAPLSWAVGGEEVALVIEGQALQHLARVIVGFIVRDRLGQNLFGDNTYITTLDAPVSFGPGANFRATFQFLMPILPAGRYAISAAIVSGMQQDHTVHEWINEAIYFESHNGMAASGMIGVPMHKVALEEIGGDDYSLYKAE